MQLAIRLPKQFASAVKEHVRVSGWQTADLMRTFICLGAAFFFLAIENQDREEAAKVLLGVELLKFSSSFMHFGERQYSFRMVGRKSTSISLSLPQSVCDQIAAYAELKKVSRNQAYYKCLQQGLLIYLKAHAGILKALRNRDAAPATP